MGVTFGDVSYEEAMALGRDGAALRGALRYPGGERPRLRLDGVERGQPRRASLAARPLQPARAGGSLGRAPRHADRLRHRLPAGPRAPRGRRLRRQRLLELLERRRPVRLEHAGDNRARRRPHRGPPHVPLAEARLRDRGRLAGPRHAEHRLQVRARHRDLRSTPWPAPTGSTTTTPSSAYSATSMRSPPTSASAGTPRARRGGSSPSAGTSRARRSDAGYRPAAASA